MPCMVVAKNKTKPDIAMLPFVREKLMMFVLVRLISVMNEWVD